MKRKEKPNTKVTSVKNLLLDLNDFEKQRYLEKKIIDAERLYFEKPTHEGKRLLENLKRELKEILKSVRKKEVAKQLLINITMRQRRIRVNFTVLVKAKKSVEIRITKVIFTQELLLIHLICGV